MDLFTQTDFDTVIIKARVIVTYPARWSALISSSREVGILCVMMST